MPAAVTQPVVIPAVVTRVVVVMLAVVTRAAVDIAAVVTTNQQSAKATGGGALKLRRFTFLSNHGCHLNNATPFGIPTPWQPRCSPPRADF
jgi:hypothetical protein